MTDRPRILAFALRYPYPTSDGFSVRVADLCAGIAEDADVHLLIGRSVPADAPGRERFASVTSVERPRRPALARWAHRLRCRVRVPHFDDPCFTPRTWIDAARALHAEHDFDAHLVFTPQCIGMLDALPPTVRRLIDANDIWSDRYRSYQRWVGGRLLEEFRDAEREFGHYRRADLTIAISLSDHARLAAAGVENLAYVPVSSRPRPVEPVDEGPTLLFAASAGEANADAVRFFADEVLPLVGERVPGTRLLLMGGRAHVPDDLAQRPDLEFLPFLDDVDDAYRRARAVVVPLRFGSGLKIKVLESFARGRPTVLTPAAAEGVAIEGYAQETISDDPAALAAETVRALTEPAYADALARTGLSVIEEHYAPEGVFAPLREVFAEWWGSRVVTTAPVHSEGGSIQPPPRTLSPS